MKKDLQSKIDHEVKYVDFLKKRLESQNFKENSTVEEFNTTKKKYEKAKFILKMLKEQKC